MQGLVGLLWADLCVVFMVMSAGRVFAFLALVGFVVGGFWGSLGMCCWAVRLGASACRSVGWAHGGGRGCRGCVGAFSGPVFGVWGLVC